jgi:hypothetical protein
MEWIIALLRRLVSYESRATQLKIDEAVLVEDISKAIAAKEARIEKLEQKVHELIRLQDSI